MSDILMALQEAGYEVSVEGDEVHLRWRRHEPPRREVVQPLLDEATRRKGEILAALATWNGTVERDMASARTPPARAHEPAGPARGPSRAATPRGLEPPSSTAARRGRQGATRTIAGPRPDEDAAASPARRPLPPRPAVPVRSSHRWI